MPSLNSLSSQLIRRQGASRATVDPECFALELPQEFFLNVVDACVLIIGVVVVAGSKETDMDPTWVDCALFVFDVCNILVVFDLVCGGRGRRRIRSGVNRLGNGFGLVGAFLRSFLGVGVGDIDVTTVIALLVPDLRFQQQKKRGARFR